MSVLTLIDALFALFAWVEGWVRVLNRSLTGPLLLAVLVVAPRAVGHGFLVSAGWCRRLPRPARRRRENR